MQLQLNTWCEVELYLKESTGIIIPIGSTEQHGPTGFIGTDALCPEFIGVKIGEKLNVMVAPTINIGMAQHHLSFPGSITLRPSTLISVTCDIVNSLAQHGFRKFFFLNGHGGNIASMSAAFSEIYAESSLSISGKNRPSLRCRLENWWNHSSIIDISRHYFGSSEGSHATPSELALTYFLHPKDADKFHQRKLKPQVAPVGPIYDAKDFRQRFSDGRMGSDPSMATREIGEELFNAAVEGIGQSYLEFYNEN